MSTDWSRVQAHLATLCAAPRVVGEAHNKVANDYFARAVTVLGFVVERVSFPCVVWARGSATLVAGGRRWSVRPGSYSRPFSGRARLVAVATVDELEALDVPGAVVLLHGPVAAEQLTPKHYPFYAIEHHTRIVAALESARPAAILAATGRDAAMMGSLYPFSLIEDGDFDVPHAFLTDVEGAELRACVGQEVTLRIDSDRQATTAEQIIATWPGAGERRLVVSAHIDTYRDTPGALDNAAGVAVLLELAALLAAGHPDDVEGGGAELSWPTVELVPFNGEDHYGAGGEVAYLAARAVTPEAVALAINVDAVGWREHTNEVSLYGVPDGLGTSIRARLPGHPGLVEGEPWPQSDHMIFAMRGVPALAITSADVAGLLRHLAHTERDTTDGVDPGAVVGVARFIADVIAGGT